MTVTDRPYQTRTFDAIRDAFKRGKRRILVVLPTGGGKGYLAARIMQMAAEKGKRSIFFAAQRELIYQIDKQLERLNVDSSMLMAGVDPSDDNNRNSIAMRERALCMAAAKDTLWSRAFRNSKIELPKADIIHIDEAHGSVSKTYMAIGGAYKDALEIGWTATPCRTDGRGLGDRYDHLVMAASYKELQQDGFLVPVRIISPTRPDLQKLKISRGDYHKAGLEQRMDRTEMIGSIVDEWVKNADNRQTVLFAAGVQHSIHCRNEFRKIGVSAEHLDGTMPKAERDEIMAGCRSGDIMVLCNYGVAHTGVDVPRWKYMICARPTKSFGLWRQMAGRIQRPWPGNDHCMIQDHSDNSLEFGFPDEDVEWSLDTTEKIQEKKKAAERKKNIDEPFCCPKCKTVYRGPQCPKCGNRPERQPEQLRMSKKELQELSRAQANRKATPAEKQKFWDQCLGWAVGANKMMGAAAHRYKDKYGVWPGSNIQNVPRSSQWQMTGKQFYAAVVKPAKEAAKEQARLQSLDQHLPSSQSF